MKQLSHSKNNFGMFEFKFISAITEKCGTHLQLSSEDLTNILNLVPEFKSEL